uniref:Reverse transcriptase Ty1/copia-type domain-containing protein n=1 Tax=Solanum lycopersicum TaxID=4081 RepID=A0A3Q7ED94_SOLLC
MTTRSQTGSLEPKCPTSYLAMSNDVMEPSCYSQATRYAHWRRAMQEEHNALLENGTWQLVPPSSSQNIIRSKWFKPDGPIDRYKARLVVKGYHQRLVVDYVDTFSSVVKPATIHLLLSSAVPNSWHITSSLIGYVITRLKLQFVV